MAIFLVLLSVGLFSGEEWHKWIFVFFPLPLIWFWWVYRIQEKGLFNKLKKYVNSELKNELQPIGQLTLVLFFRIEEITYFQI